MMFGPIIRQICPPRPPKKIKIVAAVRGRVANGRACPSLWFAWVEFCYLLLPLMLVLPLSHYNVVFGWLAKDFGDCFLLGFFSVVCSDSHCWIGCLSC